MKALLLAAVCFINVAAYGQQKITKDDLKNLRDRMEGTFDSEEQARMDKAYHNISLHVREFDIKQKFDLRKKEKQPNGYWLYVEATAAGQSEPHRQRVYHIYKQDEAMIVGQVYELNEPLRFAGAWSDVDMLKKLTKDSLIERTGCTVFFQKRDDGNFYGHTEGRGCESTLDGASYATSEVTVYPNMLILWDRGYDSNDSQVWGPGIAGYKFRKFVQLRKPRS